MLTSFSRGLNRRVEILVCFMGMLMAVIVAAQVFSRYVLNHSLFWSEELARFLLVWLTFLGASVAYFHKAHPGVDVLFSRMPALMQRVSSLAVHGASLALFAVMIGYGTWFAWFVRLQIYPATGLPKWIIMGIVPVSGLILAVHGTAFLLGDIQGLRRGHDH